MLSFKKADKAAWAMPCTCYEKKSKKSRNKTREKSLKTKGYSRIKQYPALQ